MAAPGLNCDMWDLLAACELLVAACRIFVPRPGIKPGTLALRIQSLSHWTAREVTRLISKSEFPKEYSTKHNGSVRC